MISRISDTRLVDAVAAESTELVLLASAARATAGTVTGDTFAGLAAFRSALVQLILTNAAAAAGDTLSVYVDSSVDGGTTWYNAARFTTILGNGADAQSELISLTRGNDAQTAPLALTSDAASGAVRPGSLGNALRVRAVIVDGGAHGQTFTFAVKALLRS